MVTIGSPLAHPRFRVGELRGLLREPPANLAWWVNFWNDRDPVTVHRGVSSIFPWMLDRRQSKPGWAVSHWATNYLADPAIAGAVAYGLFGANALVVPQQGVEMALNYAETVALIGLRYAHLLKDQLRGDKRERFERALRRVQASTVDLVVKHNAALTPPRPLAAAIARLAFDADDGETPIPLPDPVTDLDRSGAVIPLISVAAANHLHPYEIDVGKDQRRKALALLTRDMGLGSQLGTDVFEASKRAQETLKGGGDDWAKWLLLGLGTAALVAVTGGLMLAAAPGVAGAAAVTSALATFGPGGMIGGLLTAGTLVSAGGGSIAVGLVNPGTTAATVEAVVATQLAAVILRDLQGIQQDMSIRFELVDTEAGLRRSLNRLEPISDSAAPGIKELKRKLETVQRALKYLNDHELCLPTLIAEPSEATARPAHIVRR